MILRLRRGTSAPRAPGTRRNARAFPYRKGNDE